MVLHLGVTFKESAHNLLLKEFKWNYCNWLTAQVLDFIRFYQCGSVSRHMIFFGRFFFRFFFRMNITVLHVKL